MVLQNEKTGKTTNDLASFAHRSNRAFFILGIRQVITLGINVAGGIFISRLLEPGELGVFGILTFLTVFGQALGDFGLGYTLIQQNAAPSEQEFSKVFTFQLIVYTIFIILIWFFANTIATFYHMPQSGAFMIRIISLCLLPLALYSLYSGSLEREVLFKKIAYVEVTQTLLYNITSVLLAFFHCGVWSLVIAYLLRTSIGTLSILIIKRTLPSICFDLNYIKGRISRGIFFQGSTLISQSKDAIVPLFLGALLGAESVGLTNWAGMLAFYPILLLNVLNRVHLPTFSRLKDSPVELRKQFLFVIGWSNRIVLPLVVIIFLNAESITRLIFGEKWLPAVHLVKLFCISNAFVATSGPSMALLNALGKSHATFLFTLLWFAGTWFFGIPMIKTWGITGFGITNIIVSSSSVFLFILVCKIIRYNIFKHLFLPITFSLTTGIIFHFSIGPIIHENIVSLLFFSIITLLIFFLHIVIFDKKALTEIAQLRESFSS